MAEILIRPMTIADYDEVHALWMTIHGFGIRAIDDGLEDVARFINRNPKTSVVAVEVGGSNGASEGIEDPEGTDGAVGDKIVGSILCGSDGRQGTLYHVCVSKAYRRQGIGRQMVGYCMQRLREMQINKVSLVAFTRNDVGNAFWNGIGWKKREDFYYYDFLLNEANITRFIEEGDSN